MGASSWGRRARMVVAGSVWLVAALGLPSVGAQAATADGALSGTVVDPTGLPLAGAGLTLLTPGTDTVVAQASVDSTGKYRLSAPRGTYDATVVTFTEAGAPIRRGTLGGIAVGGASHLTIVPAGTVGTADPAAAPVTLSGRLRDRNGNPIPGVGLSLYGNQGGYASGSTAADGTYSLSVPAGKYSLGGYFWDPNSTTPLAVPHPSFSFNVSGLDLRADRHQDLTLPSFDIAVTVRDAAGAPLAGATVSSSSYSSTTSFEVFPGGAAWGFWTAQGTTDTSGRTTLVGLPSPSVSVAAKPADTGLGTAVKSDVALTSNTAVALVAKPPVTVRGVLRDYDGRAVPNAAVYLASGVTSASTQTAGDGSYAIPVGPGTYSFGVSAQSSYPNPTPDTFGASTGPVDVTADRVQDLTVPGTAMRAHVVDPDGAAVAGATVGHQSGRNGANLTSPAELFPGSGGSAWRGGTRTSDGSGDADLVVLPGSTVSFTARPPSGSTLAGSLPVEARAATGGTVTVALRPTVTLGGFIDKTAAREHVMVSLYKSDDPGSWGSTTTAADGSYALRAPIGTYDSISTGTFCCNPNPPPPDRPSSWYLSGGPVSLPGDRTLDIDPPFAQVTVRAYDEQGARRQLGYASYGMDGSGRIEVPMGEGVRSTSGYFGGTAPGSFTSEVRFPVLPSTPWRLEQYYSSPPPAGGGTSPSIKARGLTVTGDTDLALVATTQVGTDPGPPPPPDPGPPPPPPPPNPGPTPPSTGPPPPGPGPNPPNTGPTPPNTGPTPPNTNTGPTPPNTGPTPPSTGANPNTRTTSPMVPTPPADDSAGRASAPGGAARSGYWMVTADGEVRAFGDATHYGDPRAVLGGARAVHLEPTPTGRGYWVLDDRGHVHPYGDAAVLGSVDRTTLAGDERPTSLSATRSGAGYWIFTSRGRVLTFGDAGFFGDMSKTRLNGPVLGSVATPSGQGYSMVASDGGIFTFGDAAFHGSTGGMQLNRPVMGMAPAPGGGYWLVASDGGIFAFDVPFFGSMGATALNRPISGLVPGRAGYLMVAEDGGIFSFGDVAFHGSLGAHPPASPVVSAALLP